ncbi:pyruvate formate lyase activating enzyme [Desulfonatronum thiosulfatophilum]|uniref:Pyruvate formate lyase activating enzyme n=1 Tax=Desulfonatronum thiosulfatophilum TaxID=617002 RepID=A0A1G6AH34_9BACT|nr:AmmeMemoRadiSam system radical SAM enzyme [Desulfonatronum thiosulfatophilum]SDB07640.1 pyruvate formate lyase activating enzyme [Desulfonatronum thiosulfatophilum]
MDSPLDDKAMLWKPLQNGKVHCRLCSHYCVIPDAQRGLCGVRENREGVLFTLVRDKVAALHLDPVEKKPLYHFYPGTKTLSLGTMGCNLSCSFCQNFSLSQPPRQGKAVMGERVTAGEIVDAAVHASASSISYTYSEPTIFFELVVDVAARAHERGLMNIIVSNGFQTRDCLEVWGPLIDAANIDLKAFTEDFYKNICGAGLKPVLDNLKTIHGLGWWLEVTTLIIPGLNDDPGELRAMAEFIHGELGPEVPWHLSRFHPSHAMNDRPPTPPETLRNAWEIGKQAGLHHVYVGNISGVAGEQTDCHECGTTLLRRSGFGVRNLALENGLCRNCGQKAEGRGMESISLEGRT